MCVVSERAGTRHNGRVVIKMPEQIRYGENFDEEWERLKSKVMKVMEDNGCIDEELNIVWPCCINVVKREKEQMFKH